MTLDDAKFKIHDFGTLTAPALSLDSCLSAGPLVSVDFSKISARDLLPTTLSGQGMPSIPAPRFSMPSFNSMAMNFSFPPINFNFTPIGNFRNLDTFTRTTNYSSSLNISNSAVKNLSWWKAQGYNEEKGKRLASKTKIRSDALHNKGITGQCGQGVREGINDAFYNGATHHAPMGLAAKNFGSRYFVNDKNLKKINVEGLHLTENDIPAGAIIIYEHYSKNPAGHIEVSDGNGHGLSDFTSKRLFYNNGVRREPKEIWIPV